jgi:ABC-type branched-subunit amino acid transport system ATPase component
MMLTLENLGVDLAGTSVLRSVNTKFEGGTTVAVVGRNGAGKTTLLRAIMGLVNLKSGQIMLGNERLDRQSAHKRAGHGIGYAPEDRVIYPTFTVEENLRLPCEVLRLGSADTGQRLEAVLEVVPQLKDMLRRSGAALSGGQGKMVALGRALMVGSSVVLLDEPFQGLAPVLAQQYGEAMGRLRSVRPDLCVIVTESNASLLKGVPDRVIKLERGALEESISDAAGQTAGVAGGPF